MDQNTNVWALHSSRAVLGMAVAAGGGAGVIVGNAVEGEIDSR